MIKGLGRALDLVLLLLISQCTTAFIAPCSRLSASLSKLTQHCATAIDTSFMWTAGLSFGKGQFKFYKSFDEWMKPFPDEDRIAYPEVFNLPKGVYEVKLLKPLGIVFEEIESGKGLYVQDLVEGGNAEIDGTIEVNDVLVGITAVKIVGAKYERRMIPARNFDFDTMIGAVASNDPKWGCSDVVLMVERPEEADSDQVSNFMDFFEPPIDSPWKQPQ